MVTPPLPENFVPFRHCFGKASRARENFGFFRRCFGFFRLQEQKKKKGGSTDKRWVGELQKRGRVSLLAPDSW